MKAVAIGLLVMNEGKNLEVIVTLDTLREHKPKDF